MSRGSAEAPAEKPICERCGEEDSDDRLLGKVDTCQSCVASDAYRIEQLTDILQRFIDGGRLESLLQACNNAGIKPKQGRESDPTPLAPITHVAIRVDGVVWSLPKPFRHHHCVRLVADLTGAKYVDCSETRGDQGFLDANGVYLDRVAALARALALKQVKDENDIRAGMLFSEDLW